MDFYLYLKLSLAFSDSYLLINKFWMMFKKFFLCLKCFTAHFRPVFLFSIFDLELANNYHLKFLILKSLQCPRFEKIVLKDDGSY